MNRPLPIVFRHSVSDSLKLAMIPVDAADRLAGEPTEGDWDTVASRLNVGCILARWHFPEANEAIEEALNIVANNKTLNTEQHSCVVNMLHLVTQMESKVTRRQLSKAILYVFKNAGK